VTLPVILRPAADADIQATYEEWSRHKLALAVAS